MSYFATVHLANGSAVQINGGRTKFFTPGRDDEVAFEKKEVALLQEERRRSDYAFFGWRGMRLEEEEVLAVNPNQTKVQIAAVVDIPTRIIRGEQLMHGSDKKDFPF
jgi:hypothetical protein